MATLTFVNTTGAPGLSRDSAKKMRGHITRVNFAKRRERKSGTQLPEKDNESGRMDTLKKQDLTEVLSNSVTFADAYRSASTFTYLWSTMFMDGENCDGDNPEQQDAFMALLVSDPALLDATLAIGMRYWSSEPTWKWTAGIHSHRAVNSMIERIGSGRAFTEGALGAALTMAFGERLMRNEDGCNVHIDGAAQIIRERRARGIHAESPWFVSLVMCECVNYALGFPRIYHRKIIDAMGEHGDQVLKRVADMTEHVIALREVIDTYHKDPSKLFFLFEGITKRVQELHSQANALQVHDNTEVQAASTSIQLILHLIWPSSPSTKLTPLATDLKTALSARTVTPCCNMDMTSCQLLLGAVSADDGSEMKAWFAERLKRAVLARPSRGWAKPVMVEEYGLVLDQVLVAPLQRLWGSERGELTCRPLEKEHDVSLRILT